MVNIRDRKSNVFAAGEPKLSWKHLTESFHSLACLCAEKAREKGYDVFGLQFYGECWGQVNGTDTYSMFGAAQNTSCVMDYAYTDNKISGMRYCDIFSEQECVGVLHTNYVYRLEEAVDGGFTPWEPVPECTKTCGGGTQKFVRNCTNPPPQFGGKDCIGPREKFGPCNDFKCPIPCAIDLGVILDATNSVGIINFNISKKFVLALVNSMKIAPGASHLALMVYNKRPTMLLRFNEADKQNPSVIKGILQRTEKLRRYTFTDKAIKTAGDEMFTAEGGDRPDKQDVLVILTDGRTNKYSQPYENVNQPLRAKGVKVIAVGVGKKTFKEELIKIAMGKEENVLQVSDFHKLTKELLQPIIDLSCPTAQ